MKAVSQIQTLPLIEQDLPREDLSRLIAALYNKSLAAKGVATLGVITVFNTKFAEAVLTRNFIDLEHITNGLNDTGKAVFAEVTGVRLPKGQKVSREALRDWCGVSALDEQIRAAHREVKSCHDAAARHFKTGMPQIVAMVQDWYDKGFVVPMHQDKKHWLCNRALTSGMDLSARGVQGAQFRPYLEAFLKLQELRVQKGEIQEPLYVDPKAIAAPPPATTAAAAQVTEQTGFGF